jgi:hypothetical protein
MKLRFLQFGGLGFAIGLIALSLFITYVQATRPTLFERLGALCRDLDDRADCSTAITGGRARAYCLRLATRGVILPEFECEIVATSKGPWQRPAPDEIVQVRMAALESATPDWATRMRRTLAGSGRCLQAAIEETQKRIETPQDGYWTCVAGERRIVLQVDARPPAWESNAKGAPSPMIEVTLTYIRQ